MRLTKQRTIGATKAILGGCYNLASGGIPPHVLLLEELVGGKPLTEYAQKTFLAADASNLLTIPGLTYILPPQGDEEAISYFGGKLAASIQQQKAALAEISAFGGRANIRYLAGLPADGDTIDVEGFEIIISRLFDIGYLSRKPPLDHIERVDDIVGLMIYVFNNGGEWTQEGLDSLESAHEQWLKEPLYQKGISLHIQKVDLMNSLLAHSIEKMGQFADPANFDPKAYFESNRGSVKEWETAFQKYFHRSVPSAIGLLEWSQQALNDAKNFFQT